LLLVTFIPSLSLTLIPYFLGDNVELSLGPSLIVGVTNVVSKV